MTINRIKPGAWNSRAVVHGGLAYLSGIVAPDKSVDIKGQTEQVLQQIDGFLAEVGSDKSRILTSMVYMADLGQKDAMNEVWMAWLDPQCLPARAAVGVQLTQGTLVEIMITAAV
jgi:enamine deaminase RidA (YjgF/YER057c/UK114 family)